MKFEKLLKKLTKNSTHHQHRISCVIAKKNRIVSIGWNEVKTHPKSIASYNMLHAEISALLGLSFDDLRGCVAYVYREDRQGVKAMSKPCPGCTEALRLAGIKTVYYTVKNGYEEKQITSS